MTYTRIRLFEEPETPSDETLFDQVPFGMLNLAMPWDDHTGVFIRMEADEPPERTLVGYPAVRPPGARP